MLSLENNKYVTVMFKEVVEVIEVLDKKVKVRFEKNKACLCCNVSQICNRGDGILIIPKRAWDLKSGGRVEISIDERKVFLANLLLFLLPLVIFITTLILTKGSQELFSFLYGFLAIFIYYVLVKIILKKHGHKFDVKILRKV